MEEQIAPTSSQVQVIGVKSWLAYAGVAALAVILFGVLLPLSFLWHEMAARMSPADMLDMLRTGLGR